MKKWRDLFATKKMSKKGTRVADVHLYEPPQETQTPCRICNGQEVEDVRDKIIGELSPSAEKTNCLGNEEDDLVRCLPCGKRFKSKRTLQKHRREFHPDIRRPGEKSESKKVVCPQCSKEVSDIHLQKHLQKNCRQGTDNLSECTFCKMMFPTSRLKEHENGRVDKNGKVVRKGCAEKQGERKPENKGERVICDQCGKTMNKAYMPTHKKLFHKESSQSQKLMTEYLAEDMAPRNEKPTSAGEMTSKESVVKGSDGVKSKGDTQQRRVFLTREAMEQAMLDCQFEMETAEATKASIEENKKHLGQVEMIQRGARFLAAMGITVREPTLLIPMDGDCLFSCVAMALDPNLGVFALHTASTKIRVSCVDYGLKQLDNISPEKQQWLAGVCLERGKSMMTTEEMKARLEQYKKNGTYEGKMGDAMPHLAAAKYGTPILIIDIHDETHRELAHFVSPGDIFGAQRNPAMPIIVVVRHYKHFEVEIPTEEGRNGLQFLLTNCAEEYIENQGREPLAESGCKPPKAATNNDKRGPSPGSEGDGNSRVQPGRQSAPVQGFLSDSVRGGGWIHKIIQILSFLYCFYFQGVNNHQSAAATAQPATPPCRNCSSPTPGLVTGERFWILSQRSIPPGRVPSKSC